MLVVTCKSNVKWTTAVEGSKGAKYTVCYDVDARGDLGGKSWTCTCKAFEHYYDEKGPCKHIKRVIDEGLRCGWNEKLDPNETGGSATLIDEMKCPMCKGPVEFVEVP